ncbi:hypothetical protein TWF281_001865 [Arthrobotrys megalospora]
MQQEQHSHPLDKPKKRGIKIPNLARALQKLYEDNTSDASSAPSLTLRRRRRRKPRQKSGDHEEEPEEELSEIKLDDKDSDMEDAATVTKKMAQLELATAPKATQKHKSATHQASIPKISTENRPKTKNQKRVLPYTPIPQDPQNPNHLSKTQRRKLRYRDRLLRIQQQLEIRKAETENTQLSQPDHQLDQEPKQDGNVKNQNSLGLMQPQAGKSGATLPGTGSSSTPHLSQSSYQPMDVHDHRPAPQFATAQRPTQQVGFSTPVDEWLHIQTTSGPWSPLRTTTSVRPQDSRDRRHEHIQRIQSDADRNLQFLNDYLAELERPTRDNW